MLLLPLQANALDWELSKSVSVTGTYTDNVGLDTDGKQDFLIEVRPQLGLKRESSRLKTSISYSPAIVERTNDGSLDLSHFLSANGTLEAMENVVFLDAKASAGISSISRDGSTSVDYLTDSGDTTQTFTYSLSPYMRHHLGRYANTETRLTFDSVTNADQDNGDSTSYSASFKLSSGAYFSRAPWSITSSRQKVNNDGGNDDEYTKINGRVNYRLTRHWTPFVSLGYEDNDIITSQESRSGMTWDTGFTWTPNPRTSASASYGEHSYGSNWAMDLKYSRRLSKLFASYSRSLTNSRTQQLSANYVPISSLVPAYVLQNYPNVDPSTLVPWGTLPTLVDENYVNSSFRIGYNLSTRRSKLALRLDHIERTYEISGNDETDLILNASLSRELTPRWSATTSLTWDNRETSTSSEDETTITATVGLSAKVGRKSTLSFNLRRAEQNGGSSEYDENRASVVYGLTL